MSNPLDFTGPEFLQFYLLLGAVSLPLLATLRWFGATLLFPGPASAGWRPGRYPKESESYHLALLRGGREEVVRTLLARLVTAKLVTTNADDSIQALPDASPAGLLPLEAAALAATRAPILSDHPLAELAQPLGDELERMERELTGQGLLRGDGDRVAFRLLRAIGLLLPAFGVVKLVVALGRGHGNVGFLILLIVGYALAVVALLPPPRETRAGAEYLRWLREAHQGLLQLQQAGRRQNVGEFALCAGIYGLAPLGAVLGVSTLERALRRLRQPKSSGSGCSGGSCSSSSCGGSSCSGGCGGGGGCGGCGGG